MGVGKTFSRGAGGHWWIIPGVAKDFSRKDKKC